MMLDCPAFYSELPDFIAFHAAEINTQLWMKNVQPWLPAAGSQTRINEENFP
jgi:hypothetical protein